jgi:hypothetical protein
MLVRSQKKEKLTIIVLRDEACPFVIVIDLNNFNTLCRHFASTIWLKVNEWLGFLNNTIELGLHEPTRRCGVRTGGLAPGRIIESCLALRLLAAKVIESAREGYCLITLVFASVSVGNFDRQRPSSD